MVIVVPVENSSRSKRLQLLGGILKSIDNFDMSTFQGRLIFQKTVYLLQAFRIYLGYSFSLYLHGPYSPDLTRDGFEMKDKIKHIPKSKFQHDVMEKNFKRFLSFIENFKDNPNHLEILASLHLFKRLFPNESKDQIIKRVLQKKPYLSKDTCESDWKQLEKFSLV